MTTATGLVFLDTNILVYAYDKHEKEKGAIAAGVVRGLWSSDRGVLSTQVLQEFYAVVTRKLHTPLTKSQARTLVAEYGTWRVVDTDTLLIVSASKLEEDHSLSWWDCLVVSAALRSGASVLLSEDLQDGRRFGGLTVRNPFAGSALT